MWRLKACPRCGGDFFSERDFGRWDMVCLQCGYRVPIPGLHVQRERVAQLPSLVRLPSESGDTSIDSLPLTVSTGGGA